MKMNPFFRKSFFNVYSVASLNLVLQIVVAATNFILAPLIINALGSESYALWITINAFSSLLLIADWGFLNTFRVKMTKIYNNHNYFARQFWNRATLLMHLSAFSGFFILTITYYLTSEQGKTLQDKRIFLVTIALLTSYLTLFEHLFLVKLQILKMEIKSNTILIINRLTEGILQVLILIIHPSIHLIFFVPLFCRFGSLIFFALVVPRSSRTRQLNSVHKISMLKIVKQSVGSSMFVFSNMLYSNILTLILSRILTTELLVVVQISRMLVSPIRMIGSSIAMGTLQYELRARFHYRMENQKLDLRNVTRIFSAMLFLSLVIMTCAPTICKVLFPNISEFTQILFSLFVVQYLLDSMIWIVSGDFYNVNRLFKLGLCNLLLSSISVFSTPFFVAKLGIIGVPLSLVIGDVLFLSLILSLKGRTWLFR